jgi:hypothetical protein
MGDDLGNRLKLKFDIIEGQDGLGAVDLVEGEVGPGGMDATEILKSRIEDLEAGPDLLSQCDTPAGRQVL